MDLREKCHAFVAQVTQEMERHVQVGIQETDGRKNHFATLHTQIHIHGTIIVNFESLSGLDINECEENPDICDVNAECFNFNGTFACVCNEGYSGDGDGAGVTCNGMMY